MNNTVIYLIILALYLSVMVGIGILFFLKNRNVSDYVLGNRQLNPWVAAMSAQASDMSGWLLLGLPGTAYVLYSGTSEAIWTAVGLFIGTYLNWRIVASRLRRFTCNLGAITLPDYFAKRFNDQTGLLRAVTAVFILIFFLFYTASMFSAGAKLFCVTFGLDYQVALFTGTSIIVLYTFLGGFLAVCWTDMIQGVLMFCALLITPVAAWLALPDQGNIPITSGVFTLFPMTEQRTLDGLFLISCLGWGLGYFGQPHILPRFMGIRSESEIRPARRIAMIWVAITLGAAIACGVIGHFLYPNLSDPETVFIVLIQNLFPPIITGILLTAILSAIMSTADSQLLVASSSAASDLYRDTFRTNASERSTLWVSRATVIFVSVIAALIVCIENPDPNTLLGKINTSVFKLVAFAWAGFGAAFGPILLASLFWRRTTKAAAVLGICVGAVTAFIWRINDGGIFDVYELVPGFILSAAAIFIASIVVKPRPELENIYNQIQESTEK